MMPCSPDNQEIEQRSFPLVDNAEVKTQKSKINRHADEVGKLFSNEYQESAFVEQAIENYRQMIENALTSDLPLVLLSNIPEGAPVLAQSLAANDLRVR